jgi:hypothetical protein
LPVLLLWYDLLLQPSKTGYSESGSSKQALWWWAGMGDDMRMFKRNWSTLYWWTLLGFVSIHLYACFFSLSRCLSLCFCVCVCVCVKTGLQFVLKQVCNCFLFCLKWRVGVYYCGVSVLTSYASWQ